MKTKLMMLALLVLLVMATGCGKKATTEDNETANTIPEVSLDNAVYVSATGKESNTGAMESPKDFLSALSTIEAGGVICMLRGNYSLSSTVTIPYGNNGEKDSMKTIVAYDNEKVILDFSSQSEDSANRGIKLEGNYWFLYGLSIYGAGDNGILLSGNNNIIADCEFSYNRDTGLQLSRRLSALTEISQWPTNNFIKNCTSFMNADSGSENADGFAAKLTCGAGNVFDGCMAYCNSDDGWDLYTKEETGPIGGVTLIDCVAFNNGYQLDGEYFEGSGDGNGFKLGGENISVEHTVINCVAFGNGNHGFTDNSNPGPLHFENCTTYNNSRANGTKSNFNANRSGLGNNTFKGILSVQQGLTQTAADDEYKGVGEYSIWYNEAYYQVGASMTVDQNVVANRGTLLGSISENKDSLFFENIVAPEMTDELHEDLRKEDGSVCLGSFLRVLESSVAYTAGADGVQIGASLHYSPEEASVARIEVCISLISKIRTVSFTPESKAKIDAANNLYDTLTTGEKALITTYSTLTTATDTYRDLAISDCISLIDDIGAVGILSKTSIVTARSAYDLLLATTSAQQSSVTNYSVLVAAELAYVDFAPLYVIDTITDIGIVTLDSEDDIVFARDEYDWLTSAEKALVTNYQDLVDAENQYAALVCIEAIDDIGEVTILSSSLIVEARGLYDSLTAAGKALTINYQDLVDAEEDFSDILDVAIIFLPSDLSTTAPINVTTPLTTEDGIFTVGPGSIIYEQDYEEAIEKMTYNGITYTKGFDSTGGGDTSSKYIKFTTTGAATIMVVAYTNNDVRDLELADSTGTRITSKGISTTTNAFTYNVTEAGTYYLYSGGSGIKVLSVIIVED